MRRSANKIGSDAEAVIEDRLGGRRVTQSGGGKFWKLDVNAGQFVIESKATDKDFIRITLTMFKNVKRALCGGLKTRDGARGAIIATVQNKPYIIMELDDWVEMVTMDPAEREYIEPTKAEQRRARARLRPSER